MCNYAPRYSELNIDYIGVIIGILSFLVTVLLGWNIYTLIDTKEIINKQDDKIKNIEKGIENAFNNIHDKVDYNLGLMYSYFAQMLALNIGNQPKDSLKYLLVAYMVNGIKTLLKQQNTSKEIDSTINSVLLTYQQTPWIPISKEQAITLIKLLGEIEGGDKIDKLKELEAEISKYI